MRGLVLQNIRRAPLAFGLSAFGIALGVCALSFFLALGAGVRVHLLAKVFPVGRIEVTPARSSLSGDLGGMLGIGAFAPRRLDQAAVTALTRFPEVDKVFPRMKAAFPARGWGGRGLLGRDVHSELVMDGVDPQAVEKEGIGPLPFEDSWGKPGTFCTSDDNCQVPTFCAWDENRCQQPIPVLVSPFLLELYNGSIAKVHNLPKIGSFVASTFRGLTFTGELGRSFVSKQDRGTARQRRFMLVGISEAAMPLGLTVPLPYIKRWNEEYTGNAAEYSSLWVTLRKGQSVTRLVERIRKEGFAIEETGAEQAGLAVTLLSAVFLLISLSILALSAVNIAHSFFRQVAERRREFGVMLAVGASPANVLVLMLQEAALIGLLGGLLGLVGSRLFAWVLDYASAGYLPDFPFKPRTYFEFTVLSDSACLAFAILACIASAYLPARAAARTSPALALTQA